MALFGSARDASLIRHINNELIVNYIDVEIEFYKLVLAETRENLYGESDSKTYYNPMKIPCLVLKEEKTIIADDYGLDATRTGIFAFSRDYLKDRKTYIYGMMKEFNWQVIEDRVKVADKIGRILP